MAARARSLSLPVAVAAVGLCLASSGRAQAPAAPPPTPSTATGEAAAPDDHQLLSDLQREVRALRQRLEEREAASSAPATPSAPPPAAVEAGKPLDVREPPFSEFDFSWLNGNSYQPSSLLTVGPLTWTLFIDAYYAFQLRRPVDHTIFPTTTAARHNELSFNLGILGVEITGLDGPTGRLFVQYGSNLETDAGQDPTTRRGYFLSASAFKYIQQAAVGWHFHALHGVNLELGIFSSYVGLESYLPQENWSYTHAFIADATPYYFFGLRGQIFATRRLKVELWLVNGWQTFGQWHEAKSGGYYLNWRPRPWLSLVHSFYIGQEVQSDAGSLRPYSDNNLQIRYFQGGRPGLLSAAISLTLDLGYELRSSPTPSGWMGGAALSHRLVFLPWLASTVRGDFLYDQTGAIVPALPLGNPYDLSAVAGHRPDYWLGGVSVTLDALPNPWVLFRLEYSHRQSNRPYFGGHAGLSPTGTTALGAPDPPLVLETSDDRVLVNATLRL